MTLLPRHCYLDTQINKSSKINSTVNVKFLRLLSQGNIERLGGFQLSLLGNNGIALDFFSFWASTFLNRLDFLPVVSTNSQ